MAAQNQCKKIKNKKNIIIKIWHMHASQLKTLNPTKRRNKCMVLILYIKTTVHGIICFSSACNSIDALAHMTWLTSKWFYGYSHLTHVKSSTPSLVPLVSFTNPLIASLNTLKKWIIIKPLFATKEDTTIMNSIGLIFSKITNS